MYTDILIIKTSMPMSEILLVDLFCIPVNRLLPSTLSAQRPASAALSNGESQASPKSELELAKLVGEAREREREREIHVYMYIHMHVHIHKTHAYRI